jgi:hypothetical protein
MEPQITQNTQRATVPCRARAMRLISRRGLPKLSSRQRCKPVATGTMCSTSRPTVYSPTTISLYRTTMGCCCETASPDLRSSCTRPFHRLSQGIRFPARGAPSARRQCFVSTVVNRILTGIHLRILRVLRFHFPSYFRHTLSNSLTSAVEYNEVSLNPRAIPEPGLWQRAAVVVATLRPLSRSLRPAPEPPAQSPAPRAAQGPRGTAPQRSAPSSAFHRRAAPAAC